MAVSVLTKGVVAHLGPGKDLLDVGQAGVDSLAAGAGDVGSAASSALGPAGDAVSAGLSSALTQASDAASSLSSALDLDFVGSLVEGLNSLASSLPIVGTAAAALVVLFNVYKQVQFNKAVVDVFAIRVQDLTTTFLEIAKASGSSPAPQMRTFSELLKNGSEIVKQFTSRGFMGRLLKGKSDVTKLQSVDEAMTKCIGDLSLFVLGRSAVNQANHFEEVRRNNEAIIERIEELGGPEAVARDPVVAAQVAEQLGLPVDELKKELAMHFEALVEGQARLEAFLNEGPHLLISNFGMRSCWRIYCRSEKVSPKSLLSATKAFCITQLQLDEAFVNELVTDELIDLIDEDGDGVVSVVEVARTFADRSVSLLDILKRMRDSIAEKQNLRLPSPPHPYIGYVDQRKTLRRALSYGTYIHEGVCTAATESTPASELVTTQIHVVVGPHHSGRTAFCAKVLQEASYIPNRFFCFEARNDSSDPMVAYGRLLEAFGVESKDGDHQSAILNFTRTLKTPSLLVVDGQPKPALLDFLEVLRLSSRMMKVVVSVTDLSYYTDAAGRVRPDILVVRLDGFSAEEATIFCVEFATGPLQVVRVDVALRMVKRFGRPLPGYMWAFFNLPESTRMREAHAIKSKLATDEDLLLTGVDPRLAQLTASFKALSKGELYILTFLAFSDSCVDANSLFELVINSTESQEEEELVSSEIGLTAEDEEKHLSSASAGSVGGRRASARRESVLSLALSRDRKASVVDVSAVDVVEDDLDASVGDMFEATRKASGDMLRCVEDALDGMTKARLIDSYVNATGRARYYVPTFNGIVLRNLIREHHLDDTQVVAIKQCYATRIFRLFGRRLRTLCSMYNSGHVMASMRMFDDDRAFFNQVVGAIETGNIPPCCTQVAVSLIDNLLVLSARLKGDRLLAAYTNLMRLCETRCKSIRLYAMAFVAFVFLLQGRLTEGSVYGRAAVELSEGIEKEQPGVATFPYQMGKIMSMFVVAAVSMHSGNLELAERQMKSVAETMRAFIQLPFTGSYFRHKCKYLQHVQMVKLSIILRLQGKLSEALTTISLSVDQLEAILTSDHPFYVFAQTELGQIYTAMEKPMLAAEVFRKAAVASLATQGAYDPGSRCLLRKLAAALFRCGKVTDAAWCIRMSSTSLSPSEASELLAGLSRSEVAVTLEPALEGAPAKDPRHAHHGAAAGTRGSNAGLASITGRAPAKK